MVVLVLLLIGAGGTGFYVQRKTRQQSRVRELLDERLVSYLMCEAYLKKSVDRLQKSADEADEGDIERSIATLDDHRVSAAPGMMKRWIDGFREACSSEGIDPDWRDEEARVWSQNLDQRIARDGWEKTAASAVDADIASARLAAGDRQRVIDELNGASMFDRILDGK
jgi:hypothetical protein